MKAKITVLKVGGTQEVLAEIIGPFGVHANIAEHSSKDKKWVVTHIKSGRVVTRVPNVALAINIAEKLNECNLCWNFGSLEKVGSFPSGEGSLYSAKIKEIRRSLGLIE